MLSVSQVAGKVTQLLAAETSSAPGDIHVRRHQDNIKCCTRIVTTMTTDPRLQALLQVGRFADPATWASIQECARTGEVAAVSAAIGQLGRFSGQQGGRLEPPSASCAPEDFSVLAAVERMRWVNQGRRVLAPPVARLRLALVPLEVPC